LKPLRGPTTSCKPECRQDDEDTTPYQAKQSPIDRKTSSALALHLERLGKTSRHYETYRGKDGSSARSNESTEPVRKQREIEHQLNRGTNFMGLPGRKRRMQRHKEQRERRAQNNESKTAKEEEETEGLHELRQSEKSILDNDLSGRL
jgi:septin family protein